MSTTRRRLVLPPPCVAVRGQLHRSDCGLAALAMALGLPYEQVFQVAPLAAREGLTPRQLQSVASRLGARLLSSPNADIHADTGILGIEFHDAYPGHWVYLFKGSIVDPSDGTLWDDPSDYFAALHCDWDIFLRVAPRVRQRGKE